MAPVMVGAQMLSLDFAGGVFRRSPLPASNDSPFPTKSCDSGDDSPACQKPVSAASNTTLPIILGVMIPVTVAAVIFLVLHRRHVRKLRSEDAEDKNQSLDFGMGHVIPTKKKRGKHSKEEKTIPEMSFADTEKTLRRSRGVSMDLAMDHPYVLPPEVHQSKDSLHSMSRTINTGDDKYRPATTFLPGTEADSRSASRNRGADDSSSYTGSAPRAFTDKESDSQRGLLRNAQRMSRSGPPTWRNSTTSAGSVPALPASSQSDSLLKKPLSPEPKSASSNHEVTVPFLSDRNGSQDGSEAGKDISHAGLGKGNNYLGAFIQSGDTASHESQGYKEVQQKPLSPPPGPSSKHVEMSLPPPVSVENEPLKFDFPTFEEPQHFATATTSQPDAALQTDGTFPRHDLPSFKPEHQGQDLGYNDQRLAMGIRPLPPDDPTEDPEQRANRIRSFYKEYFDDGKQGPYLSDQNYQTNQGSFGHGHTLHGQVHGQLAPGRAPFAQPMARRAMTPPPGRSFGSSSPGRMGPSGSRAPSAARSARAHSLVSGRTPQGLPRKQIAPPLPLPVLPTPHLLKDDSFIPMDFAPPSPFRERRAGTPDSVKGGMRPYSPTVPAHLPLASSFNDLTTMPSPHALRKSGSFTALDFAPPPRLRANTEARSDAGSIRSNRSAMSAAQLHSIRAGAYRVSRIPQEIGGTKQELNDTLRPQWDMRK